MLKRHIYYLLFILLTLACAEKEMEAMPFDIDTSVTKEDIAGTWFIHAIEYLDNYTITSPNFIKCGYDYIVFSQDGIYKEVSYNNSDCIPLINSGNWNVRNGLINVSSSNGEKEVIPVIEYDASQLVIKYRYDLDNDNSQEVFKAYLRPYNPVSNNFIASSFQRDISDNTLLKFNWEAATSLDEFVSYEIYRSEEGTCSKDNGTLITKINEVSKTTFVDYNPPATQDNLCYFLRVYTNEGLVGESALLEVDPKELIISANMNLKMPVIDEENVLLEWTIDEIPYFSHYKIIYANSDGSNLLFHEEGSVATINNIGQGSYLDTDPPYLENPYFAVYVYNIFGTNKVSSYKQVNFRRKDLIGPINLNHIEIDEEEPIVFLHGRSKIPDWATYDSNAILGVNYELGTLETTESEVYSGGTFPFRKPMNFPNGRELVVNGQNNLHFLDSNSLKENFTFESFYLAEKFKLYSIVDFTYTKNNFLIIIDSDSIFVFRKNDEGLTFIDKKIHYDTHHGDSLYRLVKINDNEIIVGHKNEDESILYEIDDDGFLQNRRVISLSFSSSYISKYKNHSFYSDASHSIINYGARRLFSTVSFSLEVQMPEDLFALGLSIDGSHIFASTIDPDWFGSDTKTKFLKREIVLFDTQTSQIQYIKTKGYPIRIFENKNGDVFSISIPENQGVYDFDVFLEKIDLP
ncbi:lipocalin family protein [Algibacter mikhailovii]|uniref:lipocalin family protein n=1 Tax=Algibacter mikhailovii TaxID=425498 RepID=UPI002494F8C6|nr:lipocalin family protein [Algibacter mikhailovii]